jgi:isoleucyl-tRNA synthetase
VLDTLFHALIRYAAPVLVFTAEEVWASRYPEGGSVHLLEWPDISSFVTPAQAGVQNATTELDSGLCRNDELVAKWTLLRNNRALVNERIEPMRRDKKIRSSLEAAVTVPWSEGPDDDFAELFIVSAVTQGDDIEVKRTTYDKCGRCWRHLPEVTEDGALCSRCEQVVAGMDAPA